VIRHGDRPLGWRFLERSGVEGKTRIGQWHEWIDLDAVDRGGIRRYFTRRLL
jgi:hypothetical protein